MPTITLDKDKLYQDLKAYFATDEFSAQFTRLKELSKTCNPFKQKSDGTPQGWSDLIEANEIWSDILHDAISHVERVCADAGAVGLGQEKCEALAQWLDDVVKLPIYLELFDKPVFKFLISQAVTVLNRLFGKDWINHIPVPA